VRGDRGHSARTLRPRVAAPKQLLVPTTAAAAIARAAAVNDVDGGRYFFAFARNARMFSSASWRVSSVSKS